MKIVHISTFQKGGAAIAALRLHQALLTSGHESTFLFLHCKKSRSIYKYKTNGMYSLVEKIFKKIKIPLSKDEYKLVKNGEKFESFSFSKTQYTQLYKHPLIKDADVINLHWISGFVDYKSFFQNINKPIVWTLHDMNPIQGGFHYKEDEVRNFHGLHELDKKQYKIKKGALEYLQQDSLTIVCPSMWLFNLSKKSEILRRFSHKYIPYGINTSIFKPLDKKKSKEKIGVSSEKIAVLFVSEKITNYRKGYDMLLSLVSDIVLKETCTFIAVGKIRKSQQVPGIKYLGVVSNESDLSSIYNAADLFLIPSREDNLPNTMLESLCCGTPVVGFNIGGLRETIVDNENGLLANVISTSELKKQFVKCVENNKKFDRLKISSNAHCQYADELQATAYLSIYNDYLSI